MLRGTLHHVQLCSHVQAMVDINHAGIMILMSASECTAVLESIFILNDFILGLPI